SARDEAGARARLRRMPEEPCAISRNLLAGEHLRQTRRRRAGDRRPPRGNGKNRPSPPEAYNAGVAAEDRNSTACFGGSGRFPVSLRLPVLLPPELRIRVPVGSGRTSPQLIDLHQAMG